MTIRRNVDIAAINSDYGYFLTAVSDQNIPPAYDIFVQIMEEIGNSVDDFLRHCRFQNLETCNGDGIREIECLMFDMIRKKNPHLDFAQVIAVGMRMEEADV